ncbi:hypothetical protein BJ741DRAFT_618128 [Chytriomyces cf. hyalinus JEL632]|nr:hypothetical protein BJ741DRAFT_618128 [Chytriomyces cf. hyalinus JEL632]
MTFPKFKLTYWDAKIRAEPIRLAFAINGIPFEDERVSREHFAAELKQSAPFGQVPILTVDDKLVFAQSTAILRYVGKIGPVKLYPEDPIKAIIADQLISHVQDIESALGAAFAFTDLQQRDAYRANLTANVLPLRLKQLDEFIAQHSSQSDEITIGDLYVYQLNTGFLTTTGFAFTGQPKNSVAGFEHIQKVVQKVKSHPAVADWEARH